MNNIIVNIFICNYAHIFKINSVRMEQRGCIFSFVIMNTAFPHSISIVDIALLLWVLKRQWISQGSETCKVCVVLDNIL